MAGKKASLSEIMGSFGAGQQGNLELRHLPKILGDGLPDLPRNSVGRYRLVESLRQRFGDNWRSLPGVSGLVKQFDDETDLEDRIRKIKAIRLENFKRGK